MANNGKRALVPTQNETIDTYGPKSKKMKMDLHTASCVCIRGVGQNCSNELFVQAINECLQKYNPESTDFGNVNVNFRQNRHWPDEPSIVDVSFERQEDAELCIKHKFKYLKTFLRGQWGRNKLKYWFKDRDHSVGAEYQVDINRKGIAKVVRMSNLKWNETIWSIRNQIRQWIDFLTLTNLTSLNESANGTDGMDLEPRWIRILEDDDGYAQNMALIELRDAQSAISFVENFNGQLISGKKIYAEYSCFVHRGRPFYQFDTINQSLSGKVHTILLTNLRADVLDIKIIHQFVMKTMNWDHKTLVTEVKDFYLMHNVQKVTGGKCLVTFYGTKSATECMQCWSKGLEMDGYGRSVLAKFVEDEPESVDGLALRGHTDQLIVRNLPWDVSEETVKALFGKDVCKSIAEIRFAASRSGYALGECIVRFISESMATQALEMFRKTNDRRRDERSKRPLRLLKKSMTRKIKMDFTFLSDHSFAFVEQR